MRKIFAFILYYLFYFKIRKEIKQNDTILSIYGHDTTASSFEKLILWLQKKEYNFISSNDLYLYLKGGSLIHKRNVWITFDDGWKSNYDGILPLLEKYKIPVTFFIATKGVEDGYFWFNQSKENRKSIYYKNIQELWEMPDINRKKIISKLPPYSGKRVVMNKTELHNLSQSTYVTIANHTDDHVMSDNCTKQELEQEIKICENKIKNWSGINCAKIYSYPNGNKDKKSEHLIKQLGYKMAATTKMGRIYESDNPYNLCRCEFKNNASWRENILQIYGIWTPFFFKIKKIIGINNIDEK